MQGLRKIKKLNDNRQLKLNALSELSEQKGSMSVVNSFLNKRDETSFIVKDLDTNKVGLYEDQSQINELIQGLTDIHFDSGVLLEAWSSYMNQFEKEEADFLQACFSGNIERVRRVTENQSKYPIDPATTLSAQGKNGIHLAAIDGSSRNIEIIKMLVAFRTDINGQTNNEKRTPLMLCAILGNLLTARALLQMGAKTEFQDCDGNTAMHLACIYDHEAMVQILFEFKASPNIRNKLGKLCRDYAKSDQIRRLLGEQPNKSREQLPPKEQLAVKQNSALSLSTLASSKSDIPLALKKIVRHSLTDFRRISLLGRGAFGDVYLVESILDNRRYAMKALNKQKVASQNILRYAMTERNIMATVRSPFLVRLYFAFQSDSELFLLMDYCPGGDMLRYIKKRGPFKQENLKKYIAEIILAVEQLHHAEILYRDLKPGNVIIDKQGHVKLTDFGLSKEASVSHSFCGSTAYLAPQMIWRRGHTKALDWYLLGVLIYEGLTGRPPFWDTNREQLMNNIKSGRYKPLPALCSIEVKDFVDKLLRSNDKKRLGAGGASEIKAHPWFASLNWKAVVNRELVMDEPDEVHGKQMFQTQEQIQPCDPATEIKGWNFHSDDI